MSLPRLGKCLGQSASVLMRALAPMGDATLAGQGGPGWVHVVQDDGRWVAHLTAQGLAVAQALARDESRIPNADAAQTNIS